jgi:hypothetical protein
MPTSSLASRPRTVSSGLSWRSSAVAQLAGPVLEAELAEAKLERPVDPGLAAGEPLGDLLAPRAASQGLAQRLLDVSDLPHLLAMVRRHLHHGPVLAQGLHDRLPDPPDGEGDELRAPSGIVAAGRLDQAEVSLAQEILEGHAHVTVLLRDPDHEAEVGLHQPVQVVSSALPDAPGQPRLLGPAEDGGPANVREVVSQAGAGIFSQAFHGGFLGCSRERSVVS